MSFKHKKLIVFVQSLFLIMLLSSCDLILEEEDKTSITVGNISRCINTQNILLIDNCYVYHDHDGVYVLENGEGKKILDTKGKISFTAYHDSIILKEEQSDVIYQIGLDGTILRQAPFLEACYSMYALNDILFCSDWEQKIVKAYNIVFDFSKLPMEGEFFNRQFILKKPYINEEWSVYEDETCMILSTRTTYESSLPIVYFTIFQKGIKQPVFEFGENSDFYYEFDSMRLQDISLVSNAVIEYDMNQQEKMYYDLGCPFNCQLEKENIVIEDQLIVALVRNSFSGMVGCSPMLSKHKKDTLLVINKEDKSVLHMIDTKQGERLLYADSKTALTYFEGKLYTYDVENWQVTNMTEASFVKKDNEYYFETCHDKLFVYENEKVIEILDLKDLLKEM